MKRIAVTGLSGVVGRVLLQHIPEGVEVIDLYHHTPAKDSKNLVRHLRADLSNVRQFSRAIDDIHVDVLVHLGGVAHIDRCEQEKSFGKKGHAWKVNVESVHSLVRYAKRHNAHVVFMSSECVFNGIEESHEFSKRNPINWYGSMKHQAERMLEEAVEKHTILRSIVAFHKDDQGKTIFGSLEQKLRAGELVLAVNDRWFSPTHTPDIANMLIRLIMGEKYGIYHYCSKDKVTPYEFALRVADFLGMERSLIQPVSSIDFFGQTRADLRLKAATFSCEHTMRVLQMRQKSLDEMFSEL